MTCEKCDDTGWTRHPWRDGYVWCACETGERYRNAHRAKRTESGTWSRVSSSSRPARPALRVVARRSPSAPGASPSSAARADWTAAAPSDSEDDA